MKRLSSVMRVASVTTAGMFALAGLGFAVATLIMGRVLPRHEFATAILMIAICNLGAGTAPAGINGVAVRHDLSSDRKLLMTSLNTSVVTAAVAVAVAYGVYQFDPLLLLVLFAAIMVGGVALAAKSSLQQAQQFQKAAALSQSANLGLLLATLIMLTGFGRSSWFPTAVVTIIFLLAAIASWYWALRQPRKGESIGFSMWGDAINFGGLAFAGEVMVQVERFLIPVALSTRELALYAIVAAIALAPYRVLEMGAGSTLPAQLRRAETIAERHRIFYRDAAWLMALSLAGGVLIVAIGTYVCQYAMPGEAFPRSLMVATVVGGLARVASSMAGGISGAFCTGAELQRVHAAGWIGVAIAFVAGYLLSGFGLSGLVYGVTCGWLFRAAVVFGISRKYLRGDT